MGNTDVGQHTEDKYFIYMQHNAVVRLDVMVSHSQCGKREKPTEADASD
jgi:hypothetical protein